MPKSKKPNTPKTVYIIWNRGSKAEGNKSSTMIAIHVAKSVSSDNGISGGHYICNKCGTKPSQIYKCVCGDEVTSGQITRREDETTKIVYFQADKENWMELKVNENIRVIKEIKSKDVMDNIELTDKPFEIYNNDKESDQKTMKSIHNFLNQNDIVLLVEFGQNREEYGGFIISTKDKILLYALRDARSLKEPQQIGLEARQNPHVEVLKAVTESKKPALYREFLKAVENHEEKITKPVITEEKAIEQEIDFLKGY
jgi:hypothetical protein